MGRRMHRRSVVSLVMSSYVLGKTIVTYRTSRFATEEALKEIHRILAPNAVLGMIWNIEECKS